MRFIYVPPWTRVYEPGFLVVTEEKRMATVHVQAVQPGCSTIVGMPGSPAADGDLEWIRHPQSDGKRLPEIPGLLCHTHQQLTVGKPRVKLDTGTRNTAQTDL